MNVIKKQSAETLETNISHTACKLSPSSIERVVYIESHHHLLALIHTAPTCNISIGYMAIVCFFNWGKMELTYIDESASRILFGWSSDKLMAEIH